MSPCCRATDGEVGKITDFYFDDERWTIRYLVADTSGFLQSPHRVLVSPNSFAAADKDDGVFRLSLTKEKLEQGPSPEFDKPVSRQFESDFNRYYNWAPYWGLATNSALARRWTASRTSGERAPAAANTTRCIPSCCPR